MDKKAVVVGYGMGSYHARLINAAPGLKLHGVCDLQEARRKTAKQQWPDIKTYARYDRVLADPDVDLVSLATPHNVHARMAIAAMRARKHVVIEKPMCLSVQEARAMLRTRDRAKVLLSVFHNRRWDEDFLTVRRAVEAGLIGQILHFETNITWLGQFGSWRAKRKPMGGWMYDWGAHLLDQLCLLVKSKPKTVFAVQHFDPDYDHEVEDFIRALIGFEDGTSASITVSGMCRLPMTRFYLVGTEGTLVYRDGACQIKRLLNGVDVQLSPGAVRGDWQSYYNNIGAVLARKEKLIVRPDDLLPMIAIAQAAQLSAAKGREVRISEVGRL
jgi:predicted dehydrogenase